MRTKRLGNTELELTRIGLGTWAIGGSWQFGWGHQDDSDSIATILEAVEQGINWIDTAAIYGCGHSETVVGRALKELGDKPIIATKCGLLWDSEHRKVNCLDRDSIINECHGSLKRLGVEVIDLYQMHWPDPDEQIEDAWEAMASLAAKGDVRYIGVSNFSVSQLERVSRIFPVASLQPPYSILNRGIEDEILGYCEQNNIGIVCYSPMQKGLLTGKINAERVAALADDDHRHIDPDFNGKRLEINLWLVERLTAIAKDIDLTTAQLAIAWTLRRDEVTAAIVGARKKGQISETAMAADISLDADVIAEIEGLLEEHKNKLTTKI